MKKSVYLHVRIVPYLQISQLQCCITKHINIQIRALIIYIIYKRPDPDSITAQANRYPEIKHLNKTPAEAFTPPADEK